jgi:hypothetical protein
MVFKILLLLSVIPFLNFAPRVNPTVIEGQVVAESSNKPVGKAYVYIVEGEEEALTDANGYFKIQTWQKFPLQLTVKYRDRSPVRITVSTASGRQVIRLKGL